MHTQNHVQKRLGSARPLSTPYSIHTRRKGHGRLCQRRSWFKLTCDQAISTRSKAIRSYVKNVSLIPLSPLYRGHYTSHFIDRLLAVFVHYYRPQTAAECTLVTKIENSKRGSQIPNNDLGRPGWPFAHNIDPVPPEQATANDRKSRPNNQHPSGPGLWVFLRQVVLPGSILVQRSSACVCTTNLANQLISICLSKLLTLKGFCLIGGRPIRFVRY